MSLYDSGIRKIVDDYLVAEAAKVRDYGDYWSASSAGYCMRKLIFQRLKVPTVEPADARTQRIFTAGHIFHAWIQGLTKEAGVSIAQEAELVDDELMVKGHFDDLVSLDGKLILIDYKSASSRSFTHARREGYPMSYYHRMQLGTYLLMLRKHTTLRGVTPELELRIYAHDLSEGRIVKISKDDLRMDEQQLMWTAALEKDVIEFWTRLNKYWADKMMPQCTCADHEGGFMAKEKFNLYFYQGEPCSMAWYQKCKAEGLL